VRIEEGGTGAGDMQTQMPPMTALRCYETAARRESYSLAAEELFLTPSAISHQIRSLEVFLGKRLFVRIGRKMLLTDAGAAYYEKIRSAFNVILTATQAVSDSNGDSILKVNVLPHFASVCLMPRIGDFLEKHRNCGLQIFSDRRPVIFSESAIDCDIRYGHGRWPNLCSDLLLRDIVTPLCSPQLAKRFKFEKPSDVTAHALIYGNKRTNWDSWAGQYQVPDVSHAKKIHVDRSTLAIDAAIAGLGIALESVILADRALAIGELVAPLEQHSISVEGYYLVYPKTHGEIERVKLFRSWLLEAVRDEERKPATNSGYATSTLG
jgi:LysR family transcriptional regulator, glycine cleavage system transcriptional activator